MRGGDTEVAAESPDLQLISVTVVLVSTLWSASKLANSLLMGDRERSALLGIIKICDMISRIIYYG
jgi:hypothetical protein